MNWYCNSQNYLHVWVIVNENVEVASSFEFQITFFDPKAEISKPIHLTINPVQPIDRQKNLLISGKCGVIIPIHGLKEYFDCEANNYQLQNIVDLEIGISCGKLDEVAKNENNESGIEDTDDETKGKFFERNCG